MLSFFLWYITITILGLLVFPVAFRILPALADRGYAFSRILGLLLWGYIFWLLGSLGVLNNDVGGVLFALFIVIGLSWWALRFVGRAEFIDWIRDQRRQILTVEILFLLAFAGWTFIRSANPDLIGTEKPMELAFINAILRSPSLPPIDPWLSGYSISYYYFGYVLVAMIVRLTGTQAGVAFNLGISLVFALSALGSYGLLFNLLTKPQPTTRDQTGRIGFMANPRFSALLGPFFILIISNFGGVLHILRLLGVFWGLDDAGQSVSPIWSWLDIGRYAQPPPTETYPHWWWWQASRIIQDFDFTWVNKGDIINEFPFFSFLLADLHPHVLAIPFALLAIALALNLFLGGGQGRLRWFWMVFRISPLTFLMASVALGSLGFFNTWDFPFYVAIFSGAYVLRRLFLEPDETGFGTSLWLILLEFIKLGFALGISGAVLYLPFYLGFQSQAGGPLPNLIYITRGIYLWIHFVPLLVPIFGLLIFLSKSSRDRKSLLHGLKLAFGMILVLLILSMSLAFLISIIPLFTNLNPEAAMASDAFLGSLAAPGWKPLILEGFKRRLIAPGTWLSLAAVLSFTLMLLLSRSSVHKKNITSKPQTSLAPSHIFSLLLILIGAFLVLVPEFVFLRDLFGYRINTIFKFYFQVWLMWGIAGAYAVIILWRESQGVFRHVFQTGIVLILALSLTYPVMGLWSKTDGFKPQNGYTLDGTAYLERSSPDEAEAIDWLRQAPLGVVVEAIGGSYSSFARMASNSGQPTVLGWEFHEVQWRGGTEEMGSRRVDIERLYCTNNWEQALDILRRYKIRYVVVGSMEYIAYGTGSEICPTGFNEIKFTNRLPLVFQQGGTSIYQVPDDIYSP